MAHLDILGHFHIIKKLIHISAGSGGGGWVATHLDIAAPIGVSPPWSREEAIHRILTFYFYTSSKITSISNVGQSIWSKVVGLIEKKEDRSRRSRGL